IASDGWPFVFVVPGQMIHLVASMTLDSARSCVMQGVFLKQGKASIVLVVIDVIIGVIVVVGGFSYIIKLSFVIIGDLVALFYSNRLGVCIPPRQGVIANEANYSFCTVEVEKMTAYELFIVSFLATRVSLGLVFLLVFSVFAMVAACVFRAVTTLSATNFLMAARVMAGAADVDVLLEGRIEVEEDDRLRARLGGKIAPGQKKSWELSDGDNIRDGGKIVG
nr:hypothetical protein [Tanacetum cinerariifolium]